jgi:hypothetical protein
VNQLPGRAGSHYISEAAGWTEWNMPADVLWYEVPTGDSLQDHADPDKVEGIWVHTWNPDMPGDEHWFWVRSYYPLDWDEWDDLIELQMDTHNMALA